AAIIAGSIGMLASASLGGRVGLYEPVHGSAPDIAGQGKANPLGAIASAALMLRHSFGLEVEARAIESAIEAAITAGLRTADLAADGKWVTTSEKGSAICKTISAHGHATEAARPAATAAPRSTDTRWVRHWTPCVFIPLTPMFDRSRDLVSLLKAPRDCVGIVSYRAIQRSLADRQMQVEGK